VRRQTPPFEAIEAFLVAARAENFRRAAEELLISPAALSRRIQTLENFLGRRLLIRGGRTPQLSVAGRRYIDSIEPAIRALVDASEGARDASSNRAVRVAAPYSLALEWLAPRLGEFHRLRPDVDVQLRIVPSANAVTQDADLAIVANEAGAAKGPGALLFTGLAVVVATPNLLALNAPIRAPADLVGHRLLDVEWPTDLWARWAAAVDVAPPRAAERYPTQALLFEAAAAGLGLALGISPLVDRFLADGRLQACLEPVRLAGGYRLLRRDDQVGRRADVTALADWLAAEAVASRTAFLAALPTTPGVQKP